MLICDLLLLVGQHKRQNRSFSFAPGFFLSTGIFFLLLGSCLTTRVISGNEKNHFSEFYNSGDLIRILLQNRISEKKGRQRFNARVLSVGGASVEGKIYVTLEWDTPESNYSFGDTIWTRNTLYRIKPPLNPGAFDFKSYAAKKNIFHQLYLKKGEFIQKNGKKTGLFRSSVRLNARLQRALEKILNNPRELSVAKALLLGDRNQIPVDLLNDFKGAGAMHILAISGLHVGIIQLILMFLTRPLILLKKGRVLRVILVLLGLWGYALLTGMAVSALRAVSMFTLLTFGQALNRKTGLLNNLVNSAFVLLIVNPLFLFDVGFQLSYSALTGIAIGALLFEKKKWKKEPTSRIQKYFTGLILVSCSAQLGVLPLSLFYFKQFSGLFLLSSLLLLPVLGATLVSGYLVLGISLLFEIPVLVQKSFQSWLTLINGAIQWLGGRDELILKGIYFPFSFWILTTACLLFMTVGFFKRKVIFVYVLTICLACMQLIWIQQRAFLLENEKLIVFHQRGESLVVKTKGSVLQLKNCNRLSEKGEKILNDYCSLLPGEISIRTESPSNLAPVRLFYVNGSLICVLGEKINMGALKALGSMTRYPDIVVFSKAPQLNLDRFLTKIQPRSVIADGSNHRSFVDRCRATCQSLGIEFHSTYEKGAFVYTK